LFDIADDGSNEAETSDIDSCEISCEINVKSFLKYICQLHAFNNCAYC